jgi:cysteine-S-conjugate beta-lyase
MTALSAASALELGEAELRARGGRKWAVPPEVLPAWLADMDLAVAPPVAEAVRRLAASGDFGYGLRDGVRPGAAVAEAFAQRMQRLHGWWAEPAQTQAMADLVQALHTVVVAFAEAGAEAIVPLPSYGPFAEAVLATGRTLAPSPMLTDADGRWRLDLDGLAALAASPRARLLLLCNPHNPTGRVFTRGELEAVAAIADAHGLVVVSDEIHADLRFDGAEHVPFATLPGAAERTVTLTSATKAFNLAGLRCALAHFGTPELLRRYHRTVPARMHGVPGLAGVEATVAAWREGDAWLADALALLSANRERVVEAVGEMPGVRVVAPEGTYLAWLDCGGVPRGGRTAGRFFLERAQVRLSGGEEFGAAYGDWARLNFATSGVLLERILERLARAAAGAVAAGS